MASSYSTDLKLELMVTGENAGTWGDKTNTNLNLVQQAIAGVESIALSDGGDVTLVMSDAAISNARNMVLKLTGTLTGASTLSIPDSIEKFYIIDATAVTGPTNLTVKTVSGTGFTLDQAKIYACYTDGTDVTEVSLDTLGGTVAAANISGTIATAQIADDAVTTAKISDNQVTTAKISDNQITTAKISDNQITTAKISDNQVTAAKLDDVLTDSGGTAGAYTAADITVDAQGRITAVADGASGGDYFTPIVNAYGPASGTATSNGSRYLAYVVGAGGGGGGARTNAFGGAGGDGGMGVYQGAISAPFSQPYSVGSGGNGGLGYYSNSDAGNPGGATSVTNLFTVNGGTGGGPTNGSNTINQSAPGTATSAMYDGSPAYPSGAPYQFFQPGYPQNTVDQTMKNRIYLNRVSGRGGAPGNPGNPQGNQGQSGQPGYLLLFDNTGS